MMYNVLQVVVFVLDSTNMPDNQKEIQMTDALEDYLETIFELVRDRKIARVRDIAGARGVKSGSVSPAMRRLADLGLIRYIEREYIDLTPEGEKAAQRIYAKHQLLTRFFTEVLKMSRKTAESDACAMEHSLSIEGMDHFVRFFEFLQGCPEGIRLLGRFSKCSLVHEDAPECDMDCALKRQRAGARERPRKTLWDLAPGERAEIRQITDAGDERLHLLDMGIMPNVEVQTERKLADDKKILITLQGFQISLSREQAEAVIVDSK